MIKELTKVELINGVYVKMDHTFAPFGIKGVNGGKLRQCMCLVESKITQNTKIIYTGCSVHSPQGPIVAAVAKHFGVECRLYLGSQPASALKNGMVRLAYEEYGAKLVPVNSGRHNVLYHAIRKARETEPGLIVEYGVNLESNLDAMIGSTARQVKNIPEYLDHLVMTCGSGVTATGIIVGLTLYSKRIKEMHLVGTGPNRLKKIHERLAIIQKAMGRFIYVPKIVYHDLFATPTFHYEKPLKASLGEVVLHPNYEAKAWTHYLSKVSPPERTLFWIVGAKPEL